MGERKAYFLQYRAGGDPQQGCKCQDGLHYNANNGRDVWYNSHHYTNCATPAMERYYLFAKYAFAAYDQNGIPYPDYGLDDEWAGKACPP